MPTALIPLTLVRHQTLKAITHAESSRCHLVSAQRWMVDHYWWIHIWKSIGEYRKSIRAYFPSSAQHVWLVLLECFVWWEVSNRTAAAAALKAAVSRTCLKQPGSSLWFFLLAFSLIVSLECKWCSRTLVLIRVQLRRIQVLFYQRDLISRWSIWSILFKSNL